MTLRTALVLVLLLAVACSTSDADAPPTTTLPPAITSGNATSTTSITTGVPTTTTPADRCPRFLEPETVGTVANGSLIEASGATASRAIPGVLWMHNDSDDDARLFAVSPTGEDLGEFVMDGVEPFDAEDIAAGPGPEPGVTYLYLADIGDNLDTRADVSVYRIPEPLITGPGVMVVPGAERIRLRYPDGPRNAETLLVDPLDGALYVVAKDGGGVYRASATEAEETMERVATLDLGADSLATAGDISPDGDLIAVRTYFGVSLWTRAPETTFAEALASDPCPGELAFEIQGESLAFTADGTGYVTVSEGLNPNLHLVAGG